MMDNLSQDFHQEFGPVQPSVTYDLDAAPLLLLRDRALGCVFRHPNSPSACSWHRSVKVIFIRAVNRFAVLPDEVLFR